MSTPEPAPSQTPSGPKSQTGRSSDFVALTKPRLNLLVLFTTLAGVYIATPHGVDLVVLAHTLIGTALVAGGAAALNQAWERDTDGQMHRTRMRPLPEGRLQMGESVAFGLVLSVVGLVELALAVNLAATATAALTLLSYVVLYTPMKRRSSLSTIVGAIPGALPPVIGWAAATGSVNGPSMVLFGIMFMWQVPHFLAIAWLYREDYARAGLPLLPVIQPDGRSTGRQALLYAVALVLVSLLPAMTGLAGLPYVIVALVSGSALIGQSVVFARDLSKDSARRLFFATIIYLPVLLGALVANRLWQ